MMILRRIALAAFLTLSTLSPLRAQDPLGWNSPRALALVERARVRREMPRGDSTLQNYQSKGNGYVYFYLDRPGSEERTLVKVDQIALDLFWKRPNYTKQKIVGLRDVSRLPNKMYYHLDHLTVVQNGFGDVIKIGDGDEVRDVPHPAAPGSDSIYDFRLADSVTIQLGGDQGQVRVYQINVRPRRYNRSAFVGSVFIDRATADIVRLTFTFTPASYVDRRLDYINISLDNGLFGGRYWLPNEQEVEIRRQIPELDFAAGAVIKGHLRVSDYAFNQPIPDSVFWGRPVSAATEQERKNFNFPADIYAGVTEEGLAPPPELKDLRKQAAALLREQRLSGLPPWRLYIPNSSAVLRNDSLEGWYGGLGAAYVPSPTLRADGTFGYAFGARRPETNIGLHIYSHASTYTLRGYYNQPRDIGPIQGMPGALNTFASAFGDRDYTDLYFTRGAALEATADTGTWRRHASVSFEKQVASIPVVFTGGNALQLTAGLTRVLPEQGVVAWGGGLDLSYVHFKPDVSTSGRSFGRALFNAQLRANSEDKRSSLLARADAGVNSTNGVNRQFRFLLGGRETLPGYDYRSLDSPWFGLARLEAAHTLVYPWLRFRLLGNGLISKQLVAPCVSSCPAPKDFDLRGSAGAGVGLFWDVIRIDVVKGAQWQTLFSVRRDFWDML